MQTLSLFVHTKESSKKAVVCPYDPLVVILNEDGKKPDTDTRVVYKDLLLVPSFSFKFYGINDGSHVYIVNVPHQSCEPRVPRVVHQQLPSIMQFNIQRNRYYELYGSYPETESGAATMDFVVDPVFACESAKLHDRMFNKIEGTVSCHRRMISRYNDYSPVSRMGSFCFFKEPSPLKIPSNQALPRFWK